MVDALADKQIRDLVASGRWVGNATRAEAWYRCGSESDQAIAARIREVFAASLGSARRHVRAARMAKGAR